MKAERSEDLDILVIASDIQPSSVEVSTGIVQRLHWQCEIKAPHPGLGTEDHTL
jgi:hypothetical protein